MDLLVLFYVNIFVVSIQSGSTPVEELRENADWDEVCKSLMDMEDVNAEFNHLIQEFESSPTWTYPAEQSYRCFGEQHVTEMQSDQSHASVWFDECQLLEDIQSNKEEFNNCFEEYQSNRDYVDHALEGISHCEVSPESMPNLNDLQYDPPVNPDWTEIFRGSRELQKHRQGLNRLLRELSQASFPLDRILLEQFGQCEAGPSYGMHQRGQVLTVGDVMRLSMEIDQMERSLSEMLSEMLDTKELYHAIELTSPKSCSSSSSGSSSQSGCTTYYKAHGSLERLRVFSTNLERVLQETRRTVRALADYIISRRTRFQQQY